MKRNWLLQALSLPSSEYFQALTLLTNINPLSFAFTSSLSLFSRLSLPTYSRFSPSLTTLSLFLLPSLPLPSMYLVSALPVSILHFVHTSISSLLPHSRSPLSPKSTSRMFWHWCLGATTNYKDDTTEVKELLQLDTFSQIYDYVLYFCHINICQTLSTFHIKALSLVVLQAKCVFLIFPLFCFYIYECHEISLLSEINGQEGKYDRRYTPVR